MIRDDSCTKRPSRPPRWISKEALSQTSLCRFQVASNVCIAHSLIARTVAHQFPIHDSLFGSLLIKAYLPPVLYK